MALSRSARRKLGTLADDAERTVRELVLQRGGTAANVRQTGHWADRPLAEVAAAAVAGDKSAESASRSPSRHGGYAKRTRCCMSTVDSQRYLDEFCALGTRDAQRLRSVFEQIEHDCRTKLVLNFGDKSLVFLAIADDDSLDISTERTEKRSRPGRRALGNLEPWRSVIGKAFGWGWITVNQQGYCDGALLSFDGIEPGILLTVAASSIRIHRITQERQTLPLARVAAYDGKGKTNGARRRAKS